MLNGVDTTNAIGNVTRLVSSECVIFKVESSTGLRDDKATRYVGRSHLVHQGQYDRQPRYTAQVRSITLRQQQRKNNYNKRRAKGATYGAFNAPGAAVQSPPLPRPLEKCGSPNAPRSMTPGHSLPAKPGHAGAGRLHEQTTATQTSRSCRKFTPHFLKRKRVWSMYNPTHAHRCSGSEVIVGTLKRLSMCLKILTLGAPLYQKVAHK